MSILDIAIILAVFTAILTFSANCHPEITDYIIQAVFTTDEDGIEKRVFKVDTPVLIHVVVRNLSDHTIDVRYEDLGGKVCSDRNRSNIQRSFPSPENDTQVQLEPMESHDFIFRMGFSPRWEADVFPIVGDRLTVRLTGGASWDFYVDEFGIPDWIRSYNAVVLGKFGADCLTPLLAEGENIDWNKHSITPFKLFEESFYSNLFTDLKKAGVEAVFIGPEYYNYGVLEGGVHYFRCPLRAWRLFYWDLSWCNYVAEPHLYYWFPAGPPADNDDGKAEYNYLTPPLFLGAIGQIDRFGQLKTGSQLLSIEDRQNRIRNFVKAAHENEIKVIAYVDFMGMYDPDNTVRYYESCDLPCPLLQESSSSIPPGREDDPAWVRLHASEQKEQQPVRLKYIDNVLSDVWLRDLNPDNYAVAPSLYGPGKESEAPEHLDPSTDKRSYRYYISTQLGQLVSKSLYDFDAIFCDDIGRVAQRPYNVSFPFPLPLIDNAKPIVIYSCDITDGLTELAKPPLLRLLEFFNYENAGDIDQQDCWREYVFGCEPNQSWYAGDGNNSGLATHLSGDERNSHIKGAVGEFLRYCRYRIKTWGDENKALISSDYYVPWNEIVACEDASATDLFPIITEYQAKWCDATYVRSFKGMRLDFNPRCNTESPDIRLAQIGIAWANRCSFWFGGDKKGLNDLNKALEESGKGPSDETFSSSMYGVYSKFYSIWKKVLANPLLETQYHSVTNRSNLLTCGPGMDRMYVVMHTKPCGFGEEYRLVYLINSENNTVNEVQLTMPMPYGERVESVLHMSPHYGVGSKEVTAGNQLQANMEHSYYEIESDNLQIVLKDFEYCSTFSVVKITFEDAFIGPLSIESAFPENGDIGVPCKVQPRVTFDRRINTSTVDQNSFSLTSGSLLETGRYSFSNSEKAAIFEPQGTLREDSEYTITVTTDIEDTNGISLERDSTWTFITESKEFEEEDDDDMLDDLVDLIDIFDGSEHEKEITYYLELSGKGYDIAGTSLGNIGLSSAYFMNHRFGVGAKVSFSLFSDTIPEYRLDGTNESAIILYVNLNPDTKISTFEFPRFEFSSWCGYGEFRYSREIDGSGFFGSQVKDGFAFLDQMLSVYWRISWGSRNYGGYKEDDSILHRIASRCNGFDLGAGMGYRIVTGLDNGDFSDADLSTIHGWSYIRLIF